MTVYFINRITNNIEAVKSFDVEPGSNTFDYLVRITLQDMCDKYNRLDAWEIGHGYTVRGDYMILFQYLRKEET